MENIINSVLVQATTIHDIERMVRRVIAEQLQSFKPQSQTIVVPKTSPRYLKKKDVATMLGVSLTTLDEWVRAGFIHPCKISSRVYFTEDEIARAMGIRENRARS